LAHSSFSRATVVTSVAGKLPCESFKETAVGKNGDFRLISRYISETIEDRHTGTIEGSLEVKLRNGFRLVSISMTLNDRNASPYLIAYIFFLGSLCCVEVSGDRRKLSAAER